MWEVVLAVALFVLFWTVVGHGLWCLFAWLIRQATGAKKPVAAGRLCPACEHWDRGWDKR